MTRLLAKILLISLVLFGGQAAMGKSYLLNQAFFEDATNALSINQILNEEFTPFNGWLAKGYSPSTYWVKLTIAPSDHDLVLRIRPPYAESIQVFNPSNHGNDRVIGYKHAWSESDIPGYSHNIKISPDSEERFIYLKIKYARSYLLDFNVVTLYEYLSADHIDGIFYIGYIVFIFTLCLGLTALWLANREIVLGVFAIQQFIAFLHIFLLVGHVRIFLDEFINPSAINYFYYLLVILYPMVATVANKLLFEEYGIKPFFKYAINSLFFASFVVVGLLIFDRTGDALRLNALIVMLLASLFFLVAWIGTGTKASAKDINLPIQFLRFFFSLNLVLWVLSILPLMGLGAAKEFTAYSYLTYNMLSGLIFFMLLLYRAKTIFKRQLLKSDALKREAENERFLREEQRRLMAMLTHEIRTPLSVLKLVVDRKVTGSELEDYANRAVTNIDSIIDKCIQIDQLDLKKLQVNKQPFNLNAIVKSIIDDADQPERIDVSSSSEIYMKSDVGIIKIIISNLISNAIKYSVPGQKIDLSLEKVFAGEGPSEIKITITNEVPNGNTPNPIQVFDKYYRGPSSSKVSGSGLGLFLVKGLVDTLSGSVTCSVLNNSITFNVCIPD